MEEYKCSQKDEYTILKGLPGLYLKVNQNPNNMIIYYSATETANMLQRKIADKTRDIAKSMIGYNDSVYLEKGESFLGIL